MWSQQKDWNTMITGSVILILLIGALIGIGVWESGKWVVRHVDVDIKWEWNTDD